MPLSLKIDITRKIAKIALITNPKTPKYGNLIINIPLSVVIIIDEPIRRAERIIAIDNLFTNTFKTFMFHFNSYFSLFKFVQCFCNG